MRGICAIERSQFNYLCSTAISHETDAGVDATCQNNTIAVIDIVSTEDAILASLATLDAFEPSANLELNVTSHTFGNVSLHSGKVLASFVSVGNNNQPFSGAWRVRQHT